MPTSLITGGAGFLGSNLASALLARGERVIILDNFRVGSRQNLASFDGQPLSIVEHDVRIPLTIVEDIDYIWNLACIASPIHYVKHPIETIETNTLGIPNVLKFALQKDAKLLHTSTSEIYGEPLEHPQKETYWGNVNPRGAHAPYKEGKRIGETIITTYAHEFPELDVRMVRIFNTYGPKMALHDGRMIGEFAVRALKDEPLVLDGDGSQTRSACYVDDLIRGLLSMLDQAKLTRNEVVNLGNPDEHSVREFAETVIKLSGSRSLIENGPARPDDIKRRKPDIAKVRKLLNWQPEVQLETGLKQTLEWVRAQLQLERK
ncbi:GDP-mannose 4,6-dehydratase [Candidatus Berkelbacteria bacterium]|nr:GDP-mannose 4,6-dehydratase [Candidatus Berkelbacteria bacterium]